MDGFGVSLPLAFLAGLVSFLSPCVLPLVPSYIVFVSGMTLDELSADQGATARRSAALHALLFAAGFTLVFMTLGAAATTVGRTLNVLLPWISRIGGVLILAFGLYLLGVLRLPFLDREARVHLAERPAGRAGSFLAGVVFGAGWTPCIGPILATILLVASQGDSAGRGALLLATYGAGLALPFFVAATGFNWFLTGSRRARTWMQPLQRVAGTFMVIVGLLLVTGLFARVSSRLADMGQLITL